MARHASRRANAFSRIFSHPFYILLAIASSIAFYYLFHCLVTSSNYGIFIYTTSIYLIYALMATSGILFSISVFAVLHSIASRKAEAASGIVSMLMPSLGGVIASCACTFPIIASFLLFIGVNTFEAAGIVSLIGAYQAWIMIAMIAVNLAIIYYYLGKFGLGHGRGKR